MNSLASNAKIYNYIVVNTSEKATYFFSDAHLGAGMPEQERIKLEKLRLLLSEIGGKAARCFILGDLFDFWFEFKRGIPSGYKEALKLLKSATDNGAEAHLIGGNHDWWAGEKLGEMTGIIVHRKPFIGEIGGVKIYAGHGDGLAPSDWGYRNLLRPILRNRVNMWLFRQLPRFAGQILARWVSDGSRLYTKQRNLRMESEYVEVARDICESGIGIVIIGHTHEPARIVEFQQGKYINIGEFFEQFSYGVLEDGNIVLKNM